MVIHVFGKHILIEYLLHASEVFKGFALSSVEDRDNLSALGALSIGAAK